MKKTFRVVTLVLAFSVIAGLMAVPVLAAGTQGAPVTVTGRLLRDVRDRNDLVWIDRNANNIYDYNEFFTLLPGSAVLLDGVAYDSDALPLKKGHFANALVSGNQIIYLAAVSKNASANFRVKGEVVTLVLPKNTYKNIPAILTYEDADGIKLSVYVPDNTPILLNGKWVSLESLKAGDVVYIAVADKIANAIYIEAYRNVVTGTLTHVYYSGGRLTVRVDGVNYALAGNYAGPNSLGKLIGTKVALTLNADNEVRKLTVVEEASQPTGILVSRYLVARKENGRMTNHYYADLMNSNGVVKTYEFATYQSFAEAKDLVNKAVTLQFNQFGKVAKAVDLSAELKDGGKVTAVYADKGALSTEKLHTLWIHKHTQVFDMTGTKAVGSKFAKIPVGATVAVKLAKNSYEADLILITAK